MRHSKIAGTFVNSITRLERLFQGIAQIFVLLLMLITVADVVSRLFFQSIPGSIEASMLLLVFIIFLGLPNVQAERAHVRIEMVINHVKGRKREVIEVVGLFLGLVILAVMFWGTGIEGLTALEMKTYQSGLISFPTWPGKLIIPIGIFFFIVRIVIQITTSLNTLITSDNVEDEVLKKGLKVA